MIPSFVSSPLGSELCATQVRNLSVTIMAFLSVNLAGIGFYSCRRGAPSPRGENFGAAMNGRTRTDYGSISTRPVSTLRAPSLGAGSRGVLVWFRGDSGCHRGLLTVLGRVWTPRCVGRVRIVLHGVHLLCREVTTFCRSPNYLKRSFWGLRYPTLRSGIAPPNFGPLDTISCVLQTRTNRRGTPWGVTNIKY